MLEYAGCRRVYHAQCLTPPARDTRRDDMPVCVRYSNTEVRHTVASQVNVHTAKLPANVKSNTVQENREEHVNVSSSESCTISRVAVMHAIAVVLLKARMAVLVNSKISQITQQIKLWKYYGYRHSTS